MKGTFKLDNPDAMEATITATLNEWAEIYWTLVGSDCPSSESEDFMRLYDKMIHIEHKKDRLEFTAEGPEGE